MDLQEEVGAVVESNGASAATDTSLGMTAVHGIPSAAPLPPMAPISPNVCTAASSRGLRSSLSGPGPYSAGAGGMPPAPLGSVPSGLGGLGRTNSFEQGASPAFDVVEYPSNMPPSPGLHTTSSGGLLHSNSGIYTAGLVPPVCQISLHAWSCCYQCLKYCQTPPVPGHST